MTTPRPTAPNNVPETREPIADGVNPPQRSSDRGNLLLVASPQWHVDVVRRGTPGSRFGAFAGRLRTVMPYAAAGIAFFVALIAGLSVLVDRFGIVVVLIVALLGMAIARQLLTLRENTRLKIEQARLQSEQQFQALVEYSSDMITVVDRDLTCRFQSLSSRDVLGYLPEEVVGTNVLDWVDPAYREDVRGGFKSVLNCSRRTVKLEWRTSDSNGNVVYLETIVSDETHNPLIQGLVLNARDVTSRKQLEAELTYLANHDSLTGLPNRALITTTLEQHLARPDKRGIAVAFIDLDHFKLVNDTLGHDAGDELLINVAERLGSVTRAGDVLGRLAGDEFIAILEDVASPEAAMQAAARLLDVLQPEMTIEGESTHVSASVGVIHSQLDASHAETLLTKADSAMYVAKRNGRGRVELYQSYMEDGLSRYSRDRAVHDLKPVS